MPGLPTLQVLLDDGSGTFPYDVTSYVDLTTGWSIERGHANELDDIDASTLRLRVDNRGGEFTLAPAFGGGVFGGGVFGGGGFATFTDQLIRVIETVGATTSKRFTGYVQDWPSTWEDPMGAAAYAAITAVDRLPRFEREPLRSVLEQELLVDGPVALYMLDEPEGSTAAGDTSGQGQSALELYGVGDPVVFGAPLTSADGGMTGVTFADGQSMRRRLLEPVSNRGVSLVAVLSSTDLVLGGVIVQLETANGFSIDMSMLSGGFLTGSSSAFDGTIWSGYGTAGPVVADGTTKIATLTIAADGMQRLYLNGSEVDNNALGLGDPVQGDLVDLLVAPPDRTPGVLNRFLGTGAAVAVYDHELSAARVASIAEALLTGFAGERSDEWFERLAGYAGISGADLLLEQGSQEIPAIALAGTSLAEALSRVTKAEGGYRLIDGDGRLVLQSRTHRLDSATEDPTLELSAADVEHDDLVFSGDKQFLANAITGSREGGAESRIVDEASVEVHGQYPGDLTGLAVMTDAEVLARMRWQLVKYGATDPESRLSQVTLDLMTLPDPIRTAFLTLELGGRITVSDFPDQAPEPLADLLVEGWTESQTRSSWTVTFNTVPASLFHAWKLGDPVYGGLGIGNNPILF